MKNQTTPKDAIDHAEAGVRQAWTTPKVVRLTAAAARFNVGPTDDSADES